MTTPSNQTPLKIAAAAAVGTILVLLARYRRSSRSPSEVAAPSPSITEPCGLDRSRFRTLQEPTAADGSFTTLLLDEEEVTLSSSHGVIWKVKPKVENLLALGEESLEERMETMRKRGEWELVMESGAEYSYWTCTLPTSRRVRLDVEIVSKTNDALLKRYSSSQGKPKQLARETKEDYAKKEKISPEWVGNIVAGVKEKERVLARVLDPAFGYVLAADSKWRDFPDAKSMPYVLGIVENKELYTLRELRVEHVAMLQDMKNRCLDILTERFGVEDPSAVRCFFHYPPQFDWLHVHFCLTNDPRADAAVERAHLLDDVCDRLRENSNFYADATLTVRL